MPQLTIRMQTVRPREPWWPDEDTLGTRLTGLVERNLPDRAATTAVVVHRDRLVLVPLRPFVHAKVHLGFVLGGLARWDDGQGVPEAIGLIGRVRQRRGNRGPWVPLATVFLEWPDGRWWHWQVLLDADGQVLEDSRTTARAIDGLARPAGLGGWWTLSRTRRPDLKLRQHEPRLGSEVLQ